MSVRSLDQVVGRDGDRQPFQKTLLSTLRRSLPVGPRTNQMNCQELASRLELMHPDASPHEIARMCLLILNSVNDPSPLQNEESLKTACRAASFRLDAAADQHAAMSEELEGLCADGPIRFSPDQIWILLRAVKVQSQLLELYTEYPALV